MRTWCAAAGFFWTFFLADTTVLVSTLSFVPDFAAFGEGSRHLVVRFTGFGEGSLLLFTGFTAFGGGSLLLFIVVLICYSKGYIMKVERGGRGRRRSKEGGGGRREEGGKRGWSVKGRLNWIPLCNLPPWLLLLPLLRSCLLWPVQPRHPSCCGRWLCGLLSFDWLKVYVLHVSHNRLWYYITVFSSTLKAIISDTKDGMSTHFKPT
jgi:hypothetical protein